jgi:hypothetical protein
VSCETVRERIRASTTLLTGERLMAFYCHDLALCDCEPSAAFNGVPTISAGVRAIHVRRGVRMIRIARCLGCGVRWIVPERRREDRTPAGGAR